MNPVRSIKNRLDARKRSSLVGRADAARDSGKWREAASLYRETLELVPADADIWVQLGHMLKESGSLDEAESAYRRSISLRPKFSDTHLMLGHALKLKGRLPEALASYRMAVALDPNDHRAQEEFARLSDQLAGAPAMPSVAPVQAAPVQGASSTPIGTSEAISAPRPPTEETHDDLRLAGDRARDDRNWSDASNAYKQYLAVRGDDAPIWVQYGHVLKESGYFDAADAAYATAEKIAPSVADTYLHHGHLLKAMGRIDDAIKAFRRLAALDPSDSEGNREADALARLIQPAATPSPPVATPSVATPAVAQAAPSFRGSDYAEAEIRMLKDRLAKAEEQLRLMQGQSRAIRVLSSELVKARQEIGDLAPRVSALEAENKDLRTAQNDRLAAIESKLHRMRELQPNHPFLMVEQHLARRTTEKQSG